MILILDQEKNVVRSVSVESPQGMVFYNDTHTEKVVDFDSTFEFDVPIDDSDDSKYFQAGNYVLLQDLDDDSILFKMTEPQDVRDDSSNTPYKHIFAENVFIYDLNNVIVRDRTFTDTTIEPVLNYILAGSGWAVDDVENVGLIDSVEFSGYTTAQEALHQVCEAFDCEVKFYVKTYQGRIVDYRCKVAAEFGESEGVRIENGTGIKGITRKQVITDVKTALIPLGATQDDGNPLTILSVNNGLDYVFDDDANDLYNPDGNGYLMTVATNEKITNANALKDWGKAELKKINSPKYQYEVDVLMLEQVYGFEAHRIRKGSHVRVVDHEMNPPVTVDARVIELNISYSDMAKSTCVIGDFIEVNSATPAIINQLRQNQQVATDAKKTAVIAGGDAAEASQKADAASQDATDAKQKADNAKQSADQAQETANQANNAANQANTAAQNALTSANGKNKNYYGIMVPVDPQEGDRWFKSVNGEEVQTFIYSSGKWEPITLAPENLGTIYAEDGVLGSVDAGVITVGMLSANRIGVGDFTNLLPNPNFSNNLDRWKVNSTNTAYTAKAIATNNGYGIELAKTGSDLTQVSVWTNEYIPVNPGDKFYVSYFINQTFGTSFNGINNMGVFALRYKSDLTNMPGEGMLLTRNPNAGFLEGIYTVPADVYFLKIQLYHGTSGTNAATAKTAISLTNIVIRKVTKGTMIEDGTISTDKLNVSSISAISTDFGSMTAGSIDLGNGKFKVDPEGNLTAKNANLTNGTFSTDYTIPVIGGNPPVYATGKMGVGNGGINATDTFTQGGKNYTRETALDGNGLSISIREGDNPAASIILDAVNSGLYFSSKASGISFAGSGTSNGTDIDTYGNVVAQSNALTWNVRDADGTNALTVPMSSRHAQYGYILTPRHIKAGNMVLSKDHSISSLDGQTIYFNDSPGGARVDIACKSVQQSSLLSMKENLKTIDLDDALQAIIDTDVRQYNFKGESNTHTSFIIDDVNEEKQYYVDPHFLSATGDGRDDGSVVGYLMLAIKKLKQEIDELKAKID